MLKELKNVALLIAGGAAAIVGLSSLFTACSDETRGGSTSIKTTVEDCCGPLTGYEYNQCVNDYQKNGCNGSSSDYGMPMSEEIKQCCGNDDGSEKYNSCVEDYKKNNVCSTNNQEIEQPALYGMPIDPKLDECCGQNDDSDKYKACVDDYQKNGICSPNQEIEQPALYGMPIDQTLEECCGPDDGSDKYKACVEDYQKDGLCSPQSEIEQPAYGMPVCDVDTSKATVDQAKCCIAYATDESVCAQEKFDKCVEEFKEAGSCQTAIGTDPVEPEQEMM